MNHDKLVEVITLTMNGDFSLNALRGGFDLFESKKLRDIEQDEHHISMQIQDGNQQVTVNAIYSDHHIDLVCDCHLAHNPFCTHSAAVLYYLRHYPLQKKPVETSKKSQETVVTKEVFESVEIKKSELEIYCHQFVEHKAEAISSKSFDYERFYADEMTHLLRHLPDRADQLQAFKFVVEMCAKDGAVKLEDGHQSMVIVIDQLQALWEDLDSYQFLLDTLQEQLQTYPLDETLNYDDSILSHIKLYATTQQKAAQLLNFCNYSMSTWAQSGLWFEHCLYLKMSLLFEYEPLENAMPKVKDFLGNTDLINRLLSTHHEQEIDFLCELVKLEEAQKYPYYQDQLIDLIKDHPDHETTYLSLIELPFQKDPSIEAYQKLKSLSPDRLWRTKHNQYLNQLKRPYDYLDGLVLEEMYVVLLDELMQEPINVIASYYPIMMKQYPSMASALYQEQIFNSLIGGTLEINVCIQHLDNLFNYDIDLLSMERFLNKLIEHYKVDETSKSILTEYKLNRKD